MPRDVADGDYARKLVLRPELLDDEIEQLRSEADESRRAAGGVRFGISVIIATHQGASRVSTALQSLVDQTLAPESYELLVIHNGDRDGTAEVVADIRRLAPNHAIRYIYRPVGSAGGARNLGLDMASREYVTFVDDDDWVQPAFLERLLHAARPNRIAVVPLIDVTSDGARDESVLGRRLKSLDQQEERPIGEVPWLLGFNACKAIASDLARSVRYDENLESGEDLVYWASLLAQPGLTCILAGHDACSYIRHLREESISRRDLDFDFAVRDRLRVIRGLERTPLEAEPLSLAWNARQSLIDAQAGFVRRYVERKPDEVQRVADAVALAGCTRFPWHVINQGRATDLVFAYCFAPFSDTSAVVASKAIAERARIVDVISNDMTGVRRLDPAVSALADRWIDEKIVIETRPAFADWNLIGLYAEQAVAAAERRHARLQEGYGSVYSRALWVGSHVAAALFKLRHWQVPWTAEFSDPLRTDATGAPRKGALTNDSTARRLQQAIEARGYLVTSLEQESLFALVERATMVLANELIFTNENQLAYMLAPLEDELVAHVRSKAVVRPHPSPAPEDYSLIETGYGLPSGVLNIGYFGSFYENRGLSDVLTAIQNLDMGDRRELRLHIFSNSPDAVLVQTRERGISANVIANPYLPYMEFLNVLTKFDVLLVNDVDRGPAQTVNPFLPSKLSDYQGAGKPVWGVVDENSALSRAPIAFKSPVGDVPAAMAVIREALKGWRGGSE